MDGLQIRSKFARTAIAHIIRKTLKKKLGVDTNIDLNGFLIEDRDNKYAIQLDGVFEINKYDLRKLLQMGDEE